MARTTTLYSDWTGGELSQRLVGRSDIPIYKKGAHELTNVLIWAHGGITKRPGTYYKSTALDSTKPVRLIPFEYSTTQAYVIELGNYTARFYRNSGIILDGAVPYEIVTPWAAEDLPLLRFVQSADVLFVVHPDYPPKQLTRTGHTSWTIEDHEFENGPFLEKNTTSITVNPTATTGYVGLTASVGIFDSTHVGSLWKIEDNLTEETSASGSNQYTDAIQVDAGEDIIAQINGTWVGSATLQRSLDVGLTWLDYNTFTINTAVSFTEAQDEVFYRLGIKIGDYTSGTAELALIKMREYGIMKIEEFNTSTNVSGTVQRAFPTADATTNWYEGTWSSLNGYPETVAFFEQRLIFGGNWYRPQTVWGSRVDDYIDFDEGIGNDDDSYSFTLVSNDVNAIRWMTAVDTLRIGTVGGEWRFGNRDSATTPTNVNVKKYTTEGSAAIQGQLIGNSVLFVQRGSNKLRAMIYDLRQDTYLTPEITLKAEHMLKDTGGVIDMTYASQPDPIIWMVTEDGTLVACTYDQGNGITAFHEHETDGYFESVTSIAGSNRDEVWVVVKRTIDGSDVRYVEQFQTTDWTDQDDAIYLDSCLTYQGAASTTISGLEHLEGEEVYIITDGATHAPQTVAGGEVNLNWASDKTHVGLRYTSNAVTMPIVPPVEAGTSMGKRKKAFKLTVNFYKTNYCKIGAYGDTLDEIPFRTTNDEMDRRVPLYTETREQAFPHGYVRDLKIHIQSDLPLPFSVSGLGPMTGASPN